jgi:pyridoxamine 5'-phosphate oxidase family protein
MSLFSPAEIDYVVTQPLGRLATVGADGRPHVMPVGVFHDPATDSLVVGSAADMPRSKKFRDARRNPNVAIVIDDLASVDPWTPRGIEIRGVAETVDDGGIELGRRLGAGFEFHPAYLRIRPRRILSWGLTGDAFALVARDVA